MRGMPAIFRLWTQARVMAASCSEESLRRSEKREPLRPLAMRLVGMLSGVGTPAVTWAQERPIDPWGMHPMWGMWSAWGSAWGLGMMFMMLVFWGLIIVGVVLAIRWLLTQSRDSRADTALDILRQRYARGEIDQEEFEAKKRDLT